jgi:hypothetical protein
MTTLIGSQPNQVPTNNLLGTMAFQDADAVNISGNVSVYGNAVNPLDTVPKQQLDSSLNSAIGAEKFGRLINVRDFTTVGVDQVYTPTAGTKSLIVQMCGGGGGSSGTPATSASQYTFANSAVVGGYCSFYVTAVSGTYTLTVGDGGLAGGVGSDGGLGGETFFKNNGVILATAWGGSGGLAPSLVSNGTISIVKRGGVASSSTGTLITLTQIVLLEQPYLVLSNLGTLNSSFNIDITTPLYPKGLGGRGTIRGSSYSATTGMAGNPGMVRIYEYG